MVNGAFTFCFRPHDFGFERGDPCVELGNRQRIEILLCQKRDRIAGTRRKVIEIHSCNVDRATPAVNKRAGQGGAKKAVMIPATMQAIDPATAGGPEVLVPVERAVPKPGRGEVLIKVAAAGVNRPDVLQRQGKYPPPPGAPSIMGLEVAGEVIALGDGVMPELIGQPMCALVAGGGYAEYCVAPAGQCLPAPRALTMAEAAAMPETLFTVWTNLFERAYAVEGDTVLVHGGTSGIGTMAITLGRLFGLNVIVTCGNDDKCTRAIEIGAHAAINYKAQDFVAEVARMTGGAGCAAVLDMVGGDYVPRNLQCLAEDGRHVSIAVLGGPTTQVFIPLVMAKRLTLTGSTLRARSLSFKSLVAEEIARTVWPHVEAGRLKPIIDSTYPLAEAAAAHARMDSGDHVGKIVLTV